MLSASWSFTAYWNTLGLCLFGLGTLALPRSSDSSLNVLNSLSSTLKPAGMLAIKSWLTILLLSSAAPPYGVAFISSLIDYWSFLTRSPNCEAPPEGSFCLYILVSYTLTDKYDMHCESLYRLILPPSFKSSNSNFLSTSPEGVFEQPKGQPSFFSILLSRVFMSSTQNPQR
jgi:hypothetical protein